MKIIDFLIEYNSNQSKSFLLKEIEPPEKCNRYFIESCMLGALSGYALNKEKNACKANFEDLFLADIQTLLQSEVNELNEEVNKEKIDYRRMLDEIADVAAVLSGMVANIMHEIHKEK